MLQRLTYIFVHREKMFSFAPLKKKKKTDGKALSVITCYSVNEYICIDIFRFDTNTEQTRYF